VIPISRRRSTKNSRKDRQITPRFCHSERSEGPRQRRQYPSPGKAFSRCCRKNEREEPSILRLHPVQALRHPLHRHDEQHLPPHLQHKSGTIEGFASKYHCTRLVHYESFDDIHRAIGREKELKGWTRAKKIALIESRNPRWADLAEHWGAQLLFAGESVKSK
jgi:hypothetical protein